jgi:enoyl-[acyl-carrier-protein] reductase (NADH)
MQDKPVALVTGANQGIGLQIAKDLVTHGFTVLVGSRDLERGEDAAKEGGPDAHALQLDVTDMASIAAAADRVREEFGRLDVLVQDAAISNTNKRPGQSVEAYAKTTRPSSVSSGVGSLTTNSDPAFAYRAIFGPVYPASKTALNAYAGTETVEEGAREAVRVALFGRDGPTGTFTRWENETIPW